MPFIKTGPGIDEDLEEQTVPNDTYDLEIIKVDADHVSAASGKSSTRLILAIRNTNVVKSPANIFVYLGHYRADDDEQTSRFKQRMLKRTCASFGVAIQDGQYDTDEFMNAQARLPLRLGTNDRNEPINEVDFPPIPHETPESATGGRRRRSA